MDIAERHHALVAFVHGDPRPVAIARLVRAGSTAEIGFEVADRYQRRGIGSALTAELLKDARRSGIKAITALVSTGNDAALGLLRFSAGSTSSMEDRSCSCGRR